MTHIAVHTLTAFPFSNPNRGELGEPKTLVYGDVLRQRLSSQSLKRHWRLSSVMQSVDAAFSTRTRRVGVEVNERLVAAGIDAKQAETAAKAVLSAFGSEHKKMPLHTNEVVVMGHEEIAAVNDLVDALIRDKRQPTAEELEALQRPTTSLDVALFGRMRAKQPVLNVDAAVAVAHAMTVNKATIDEDFWTAVDDLNAGTDDKGAGGSGVSEAGTGIYYGYAVVDFDLLLSNVGGREDEARAAVGALIEAMATEFPRGHRTSFGTSVVADYVRVEVSKGRTPVNLCQAFESPVKVMDVAVTRLRERAAKLGQCYGNVEHTAELCVAEGLGNFDSLRAILP